MRLSKIIFLILNLLFFHFSFAENINQTPFRVYIKPNAKLSDLTYSEILKTSKGIYAQVLEKDHVARSEFWVLDKKGEKRYIVSSKDIVEINENINLLPNELGSISYPQKNLVFDNDHEMNFESELSLHFDTLNLSPLQTVNDNQVQSILAPRYQLTTNYVSTLPINVGMKLSLQEAAWKNQNQVTGQLTILTYGPNLKLRMIEDEKYSATATFSYEYALTYQATSSIGTNTFSAYLWSFGIVNDFRTAIGTIQLGTDYRKHYIQLKNVNNNNSSDEFSISSIGAYLGYKINWSL